MNAWNDFWHGPVAAIRPYLFFRGFLILLAGDLWILRMPQGSRYGTAEFNVAHFEWLDRLLPLPTAGLYVGVISLAGCLALTLALTGVSRIGAGTLLVLYTYGWSMSLIDSFQHHYLISLILLCLTFFPEVRAADLSDFKKGNVPLSSNAAWGYKLLVVTMAIVYAYTAITKMESGWQSGSVMQLLAEKSGWEESIAELIRPLGISTDVVWRAFAIGTIVIELILPVAYLLAVRQDELRARWRGLVMFAAWCLAMSLHIGIEQAGLKIGWFSTYMIVANSVILLPARWLAKLGTVVAWPARAWKLAFDALTSRITPMQLRIVSIVATCVVAIGAVAVGLASGLPGMPVAGLIGAVFLVGCMLYGLTRDSASWLGHVAATCVACVALWIVLFTGTGRFEFYLKRGDDLQWLKKTPEALDAYQTALRYANRVQPQSRASLHLNMASAYHAQNKQEEAMQHARQALEDDPNSAEARYGLGLMLATQDRLDEAIAELRQAVELKPDYAEAQKDLGRIYLARNKLSLATEHLRLALEAYPEYVEAHYYLGEAMSKQNDDSRAATHFEDALKVDPDYALARVGLARLLQRQGRLREATNHYRRALEPIADASSSSQLLRRHAVLLEAATELAWIEATSREAAVRDGKDALAWALQAAEATGYRRPKVLDVVAAAYAATGNFNEAVRFQKMALQIAPRTLKSEFVRRLDMYHSGEAFEVPARSQPPGVEPESAESTNP